MKSEDAVRRYVEAGMTIVRNAPAGYYLTDGDGNYQRIDDDIALRVMAESGQTSEVPIPEVFEAICEWCGDEFYTDDPSANVCSGCLYTDEWIRI